MRILGIDPGIVGGAAIYATDHTGPALEIIDIPTMGEGASAEVDACGFRDWICRYEPDHCFIERGQAMPEQGASSGFKYGAACGALRAIVACCNVPITGVEPTAWKKYFGLRGVGMTVLQRKEQSRQRALQLVPSASEFLRRKKDHGRAEALLIAIYGASRVQFPSEAPNMGRPMHTPPRSTGATRLTDLQDRIRNESAPPPVLPSATPIPRRHPAANRNR